MEERGLSMEVLVLGWKGEHLKIRCETVTEGRQGIVTEVYCAGRVGGDGHGQKCPAHFRRGSAVSKDTLACGQPSRVTIHRI